VLLIVTGVLFVQHTLTTQTQVLAWCAVLFVGSSAASSAYLTVSELFPVELRGRAIALFYAFATGVGALGPTIYGHIVETGSRVALLNGYLLGAGLMLAAAVVAGVLGVNAERKSLEALRAPDLVGPPNGR
jgi:MFS family permease